ncbi:hypothetical protein MMC13_006626 [Lambiella insularis]|nr:hypothetical protein [Lambiella insularis]
MTSTGVKTVLDGSFNRGIWYDAFKNFGTRNMFSFSSAQEHKARRRIYAKEYSKTAVSSFNVQRILKGRVSALYQFLDRLSSQVYDGKTGPIRVCNLFRALQMDVLTAFAFSDSNGTDFLGKLDSSNGQTLAALGMENLELFMEDCRCRYFFWESEAPFRYFSHLIAPEARLAHKNAEKWISDGISSYEVKWQRSSALMEKDELLNNSIYGKLTNATQLTWKERASEIMDHIGAGQDSVPMVLEFLVRTLSRCPEMQARLHDELTLLSNEGHQAAFGTIDALRYLNAIVLEGLRLVNTIESYQTRVVPAGGCVVEGYSLPAGTIVSAQPYLVHRQEEIFPESERFNPERWLVDGDEYKVLRQTLLTFSRGPRACIGKELAMSIIKTTITSIYGSFRTRLKGDNERAEIEFQRLAS